MAITFFNRLDMYKLSTLNELKLCLHTMHCSWWLKTKQIWLNKSHNVLRRVKMCPRTVCVLVSICIQENGLEIVW